MDKHQKRLMRKIRQAKRRRYGSTRQDDELLYESNVAQHEAATPEMVRLQSIIGNQAVQRLMSNGDDQSDAKQQAGGVGTQEKPQQNDDATQSESASSSEKANALIDAFKETQQYSQLIGQFTKEDVTQALSDLKPDAQQLLKLSKSKEAAIPLLANSVQQYLENKARAQAAEKQNTDPYPFLPKVQKSVNQVLSADAPARDEQDDKINKLLKEDQAEPTEEKTLAEQEGGDFTQQKEPGEHIDNMMITSLAGTKVSLETFLKGYYKQLPKETLEEFQKLHDRIRTSSGYIAHKTREVSQQAFDNIKLIVENTKNKHDDPVVDPMKDEEEQEKDSRKANVLKAAIDARAAITNIMANKPKESYEAMEKKSSELEQKLNAAAGDEDNSVVMPDVGAIKAQGFIMSHNKLLDEYITTPGAIYGSDPKSGMYAEELVARDMAKAKQGDTVVILSAHQPIQYRQAAIINLAMTRPDLKVYVCFVNGVLPASDNRMVDASQGRWTPVMNFR